MCPLLLEVLVFIFPQSSADWQKTYPQYLENKKIITVIDRYRVWGLLKASNASSTLLEAHLLPVHQEAKLLVHRLQQESEVCIYCTGGSYGHLSLPLQARCEEGLSQCPGSALRRPGHSEEPNTETLPSTHHPESSFYIRIDTPRAVLFPRTHTSRNSAGSRPISFLFLMETLTYVRQRNYCSLKPVLVTLQGPARGQRVTQSL